MDQIDKKLLKILDKDCNVKTEQLAIMCDITPEEVKQRIKKLQEDQIILAFKAVVNWERTDVESVKALIEVRITPQREKGFDRIAQRIYQFDEVESCFLMSGAYDLCVVLSGKTLKGVAEFVSSKLSTIEGVAGTATHFILKKYKENDVTFIPREVQKERLIFS